MGQLYTIYLTHTSHGVKSPHINSTCILHHALKSHQTGVKSPHINSTKIIHHAFKWECVFSDQLAVIDEQYQNNGWRLSPWEWFVLVKAKVCRKLRTSVLGSPSEVLHWRGSSYICMHLFLLSIQLVCGTL